MASPLMRFDPEVGHTYVPNVRTRVAEGSGYLLQTNGAGFRSQREFVAPRTPGSKRVLVFGDSQSAGDGVSNTKRWTDLVELALPGVEVDNHCVSGTGTDQQFLTWRANAEREHDLVVVGVYVENIRRNTSRVVRSTGAHSKEAQYTPKPYFVIESNGITLHNVPVPRDVWTDETLPADLAQHVYPPPISDGVPDAILKRSRAGTAVEGRLAPLHRSAKSMAMRLERFRPLRAYDDSSDPAWLLLRSILTTWSTESTTPILVVPLPHYFFVTQPEHAASYQERFAELASIDDCYLFDPLPLLSALPPDERRHLWSDSIGHLSATGHSVLAGLIGPQIETLLA